MPGASRVACLAWGCQEPSEICMRNFYSEVWHRGRACTGKSLLLIAVHSDHVACNFQTWPNPVKGKAPSRKIPVVPEKGAHESLTTAYLCCRGSVGAVCHPDLTLSGCSPRKCGRGISDAGYQPGTKPEGLGGTRILSCCPEQVRVRLGWGSRELLLKG